MKWKDINWMPFEKIYLLQKIGIAVTFLLQKPERVKNLRYSIQVFVISIQLHNLKKSY